MPNQTELSSRAPEQGLTPTIAGTLFYSIAIMVVGQSFLFTILPPVGRQIGLAEYQIGMIMSVHGLFMLFTGPMAGALSEVWGRRRILVIGSSIYGTSIVMFGMVIDAALREVFSLVTVIALLIGSRAVFATGAGAVMPGAMALAADLSTREQRLKAMSLLAAATSTGAIIGPSSAALFSGLGLSVPFYVIGAFALLGTVGSRLILPETRAVRGHASSMNWRYLLGGRVGAIALGNLFFIIGCFGIYSIIGFHVQDRFALAPQAAAQMMGLGLMSAAASNVIAQAAIIRRFKLSPRTLLIVAAPITLAAFAFMAVTDQRWIFLALMAVNGFGQGLAGPAFATALSLSVGAGEQGRIAGVSASLQAMAFLIAPFSATVLYQNHPSVVFIVGCCLIFAALPPFLYAARTIQPHADG